MAEKRPSPAEPKLDPADGERVGPGPPVGAGEEGLDAVDASGPEGGDGADRAPSAAVADLEDRLRRALADLDNLRKRYDREVVRERAAERMRVAADWLPIVDNLERALQHADANPDPLVQGVQAVRDQAVAVLERLGFPRFEDVGQPFDPARHEAVGVVDSDAPAGTLVAVIRPGYGTAEAILRPAGVVVSRGRADG